MGFVIKPISKAESAALNVKVVPVPDEVAADLDGLWDYLTANKMADSVITFDGDDVPAQIETLLAQARSWAAKHEPLVIVRQMPSTQLPENQIRLSIKAAPVAGSPEDTATEDETTEDEVRGEQITEDDVTEAVTALPDAPAVPAAPRGRNR